MLIASFDSEHHRALSGCGPGVYSTRTVLRAEAAARSISHCAPKTCATVGRQALDLERIRTTNVSWRARSTWLASSRLRLQMVHTPAAGAPHAVGSLYTLFDPHAAMDVCSSRAASDPYRPPTASCTRFFSGRPWVSAPSLAVLWPGRGHFQAASMARPVRIRSAF